MDKKVCAIVVTYNRKILLKECVKAIMSQLFQVNHHNLITQNEQWWNKSSMFWVDNSYIKILVGEGIIWLPMLLLVAYYQSRRAQVGKDVFYVILACTIFMMGVSESSFLYFWANIVLITSTASFGSKGDFLNELEES